MAQLNPAKVIWVKHPRTLIPPMWDYYEKALAAVYATAERVGQQMQNDGRKNAPWRDRTGNARGGLFYAVDGFGRSPVLGQVRVGDATEWSKNYRDTVEISGDDKKLILAFSHSMWYGRVLELGFGGRYAIVLSTFENNLPRLEGLLRDIFR